MTVTGSAPERRVKDPELPVGETVVEEDGQLPEPDDGHADGLRAGRVADP